MKPLEVPIKFIIEYNVPAKFGARSCVFCRFVRVADPFKPNEAVMIATQAYALPPTYVIDISKIPGTT